MKSAIKLAGLFFMFSCTMLMILDMQNVTSRRDEIEEALSISLRNTLKASTLTPMYEMNTQDMQSEFVRNFVKNVNIDGEFDIIVNEVDERGIMDVKIRNYFTHNNGKPGVQEVRKTLLVETIRE